MVEKIFTKNGDVWLLSYTLKQARKVIRSFPKPRLVLGDFSTSHFIIYKWDGRPFRFSYREEVYHMVRIPEGFIEIKPHDNIVKLPDGTELQWRYKDRWEFCRIKIGEQEQWFAIREGDWSPISTPIFKDTGVSFQWLDT